MKAIRDIFAILGCLFAVAGIVGIITGKIDKNLTAVVFCGMMFVYLVVRMLWNRSKKEHPLMRGPSDLDFSKARERQTLPKASYPAPSETRAKMDNMVEKRKQDWDKEGKEKFLRRRGLDEESDKKK